MTVIAPIFDAPVDDVPGHVRHQGGNVQAFDLRLMRQIGSWDHALRSPSDLVLRNGLIQLRLGNRGVPPYFQVSCFDDDGWWHEVGYLYLSSLSTTTTLVGCRLVERTPEVATVALAVRGLGEITVELRRGRRGVSIVSGVGWNSPSVQRPIGWLGVPPMTLSGNNTVEQAAFGRGIRLGPSGIAALWWPPDVSPREWAVSVVWIPDASSAAQPNSGLLSIKDPSYADVASLNWDAASKTLVWSQGGQALPSAPLTFLASQPVRAVMWFSATSGRVLSTRSGVVAHRADAMVNPGAAAYGFLSLGASGTTVTAVGYGSGPYGSGPYGGLLSSSGGTTAGGPIDDVKIISDAMSDREAEALVAAAASLDGLPQPEARMMTNAHFDVTPSPKGSLLAGNYMYEATTEGGITPAPDDAGFVKGLSTRRTASKNPGLSLYRNTTTFEAYAWVAASFAGGAGDDVESHLRQFHRVSKQRTRYV